MSLNQACNVCADRRAILGGRSRKERRHCFNCIWINVQLAFSFRHLHATGPGLRRSRYERKGYGGTFRWDELDEQHWRAQSSFSELVVWDRDLCQRRCQRVMVYSPSAMFAVKFAGAHTIGKTKCGLFSQRLYGFSGPGAVNGTDPTLDPDYANVLRQQCPQNAPLNTVFFDPSGSFPGQTYDKGFFQAVSANRGVLASDAALLTSSFGASQVALEAGATSPFMTDFAISMRKMGTIAAPAGSVLEVRKNCHFVN